MRSRNLALYPFHLVSNTFLVINPGPCLTRLRGNHINCRERIQSNQFFTLFDIVFDITEGLHIWTRLYDNREPYRMGIGGARENGGNADGRRASAAAMQL
ncbi:hypothetical protein [Pseudoduganella ginsengisoli]|uniref:Uncharacterized protein n=1 Tax=Pseudoduganella ginsengisoli TaxID=1462440 RepID=A0A6L6PXU2_9BURK|nr:hypothetical protein [Pseudoduganella ginsengisoli]MTW01522.1 hypothetical protein [Pseudoduganella ginsengisoli]